MQSLDLHTWAKWGNEFTPELCRLWSFHVGSWTTVTWNPDDFSMCFTKGQRVFLRDWKTPPSVRDCVPTGKVPDFYVGSYVPDPGAYFQVDFVPRSK